MLCSWWNPSWNTRPHHDISIHNPPPGSPFPPTPSFNSVKLQFVSIAKTQNLLSEPNAQLMNPLIKSTCQHVFIVMQLCNAGCKSQSTVKAQVSPVEHHNSKLITLVANDVRGHI
ncbi:hypothetical protein ATANTOWER_023915 [Ataeniobius toweri]|uniref:Uncharacterized protein n=1 Tax=Ataeniobius toweri TaxID=208326 RepID=A0ABU7A885_9TELE|nr:hypothetical protein [Ataeniobius toweri]